MKRPRHASLPVLATSMWSASRFALDLLQLVAVDQSPIDRIILIAITQANLQPVMSWPDRQRTYATLRDLPPEHVRRPVSISALAAMLHMPFETARRRVHGLAGQGVCQLTAEGVRVPASAVGRAEISRGLAASYELSRAMYTRLHDEGGPVGRRSQAAPALDDPPVRAVIRHAFDLALRSIEAAASLTDDLSDALLMLTVWRHNIEHGEVPASGGRWLVSDASRAPVAAARLTGPLGLAESTVHRRLRKGVRQGWCAISPRGTVVPAGFLASRDFIRVMGVNHSHLLHFFNQLSRLGIPERWGATRKRSARSRRI